MNIAVIGGGYVGLVTAAGLARLGHAVRVGEINEERVKILAEGGVPIFEEGLAELLDEARIQGRISFHVSNLDAVEGAKLAFICLPTPEGEDGRADLSFVNSAVDELANAIGEGGIFVIKSTVPPGTVASLRKRLANLGSQADVVSHPEFLREGRAVHDFLHPDRIVIGSWDDNAASEVASLYSDIDTTVVLTDPTSSELIKYASNAYLAARLTFVNALANVAEAVGADILHVVNGMGLDHRIGSHFLRPGPGYGGSCFPKDTAALISVAEDAGYEFDLLRAVIVADEEQRKRVAEKVRQAAGGGLHGRQIGMWGIAFKAGTDDVRESPAVRIADYLLADGADVVAYDPEAEVETLRMAADPIEAARDSDVLLIATEWPAFAEVDMEQVAKVMKGHRVVDTRNLLDPDRVRSAGLDYWGFGRPGA